MRSIAYLLLVACVACWPEELPAYNLSSDPDSRDASGAGDGDGDGDGEGTSDGGRDAGSSDQVDPVTPEGLSPRRAPPASPLEVIEGEVGTFDPDEVYLYNLEGGGIAHWTDPSAVVGHVEDLIQHNPDWDDLPFINPVTHRFVYLDREDNLVHELHPELATNPVVSTACDYVVSLVPHPTRGLGYKCEDGRILDGNGVMFANDFLWPDRAAANDLVLYFDNGRRMVAYQPMRPLPRRLITTSSQRDLETTGSGSQCMTTMKIFALVGAIPLPS